ncbi:hypothetical protein HK102_001309 [Quaeritorhiza haematococci]|nr:hypothetical protein HK102_001309 [Quaeritorhiza haematococci]
MPGVLTPGMTALLRAKVPQPTVLRNMIIQGHRFNADESLQHGLVDAITPSTEACLVVAKEMAAKWSAKTPYTNISGKVYGHLKTEMYREASRLLLERDVGFAKEYGVEFKKSKL